MQYKKVCIAFLFQKIDFAALDEAIKEFDGDLPANESVSYFSIFLYR